MKMNWFEQQARTRQARAARLAHGPAQKSQAPEDGTAGAEGEAMTGDLIAELERRCPGCTFTVEAEPPKVRIVEYGRKFTVDLAKLGETAEEWFKTEIERHPASDILPLQPDEKYRVICSRCGPIILGYGKYRDQLARPDTGWFCPTCGGCAEFDSETYENYLD